MSMRHENGLPKDVIMRLAGGLANMFIDYANARPNDPQAQHLANQLGDKVDELRRELNKDE